jgi:hypothetical protein
MTGSCKLHPVENDGTRNEETSFEIIDGLNNDKPMLEARSLRRLSPNCGPPFLPMRQKRTDVVRVSLTKMTGDFIGRKIS